MSDARQSAPATAPAAAAKVACAAASLASLLARAASACAGEADCDWDGLTEAVPLDESDGWRAAEAPCECVASTEEDTEGVAAGEDAADGEPLRVRVMRDALAVRLWVRVDVGVGTAEAERLADAL